MSSEPLAVSFQHISKTYSIAHARDRPTLVGEAMARRLRRPFARTPREDFHALTDITADIERGEAVGIIGRNGAGKSTLLKILSRVTEPTSGRIELYGRVGSLLEVGTGFHPELTGRENVFLNGSILGMKRAEISRAFDSIVEFAQVEKFLDTPVKRFSSGMYVRLAFAVAAHLNPEILVVDEVLAVGDAEFQRRCLGKMGEISTQGGRTVLFVSHNMTAIAFFCRRVIYLEKGCIRYDGAVAEGIQRYLSVPGAMDEDTGVIDLTVAPRATAIAFPALRTLEIRGDGPTPTGRIEVGGPMSLTIFVEGLLIPRHFIAVGILTETDIRVIAVNTLMRPIEVYDANANQTKVVVTIPYVPLCPGRYWIELRISEGGGIARKSVIDKIERAAMLEVEAPSQRADGGFLLYPQTGQAVCFVDASWTVESEGVVVAGTTGRPAGVERRRADGR